MERPFEQVALRRLGDAAIKMQIAIPLSKLPVWKMIEGVLIDELVHCEVLRIPRRLVSIQRSDDRLALRPPEFHVVPIVLLW